MVPEIDLKELRSEFFDNAELHFMVFDKNLNIIDVNETLLKYYYLNRDQIVGKHILEIGPDAKEKGLYDKYMEVIRTGNPVIIDSLSHPKFGNQYTRLKAFKLGEGLGVAGLNITELKDTISALELFSFRVAHDVNSPIANILNITDIALHPSTEGEDLKMYCELIQQNIKRLRDTLSQVNQALKTRNGESNPSLINFEKIIQEVKTSLAFMPGYEEVAFEENIQLGHDFYFEEHMIVSLFQNLIDNAIKYRHEKNKSWVKINICAIENNTVIITVADNGIGIAENQQKSIFKLFHRATTQASGTGIGLYTLRYGLENLGGHITFESKENIGTTFTIYLPNKTRNVSE